jgi:hypothetical protein
MILPEATIYRVRQNASSALNDTQGEHFANKEANLSVSLVVRYLPLPGGPAKA